MRGPEPSLESRAMPFPDMLVFYAEGPCMASICAPMGLTAKEIVAQANHHHPTGISSPWKIADDSTFRSGDPNPCPCERDPQRVHYLLSC